MKIIEEFLSLHKFFIKNSRVFIWEWSHTKVKTTLNTISTRFDYKKYSIKNIIYFPVAYIKFMYFSFRNKHPQYLQLKDEYED